MNTKDPILRLFGVITIFLGLSIGPHLFAGQDENASAPQTMAVTAESKNQQNMDMEHGFPHPFLAHMGIADQPGMVSLRAAGYRQYLPGNQALTDFAFHLEAGLYSRLGIHVRNDAIRQDPQTDIMLTYTVIKNKMGDSGLSVFGAIEVPTGTVPAGQDKVIGAFGVSGRQVFGDAAILDADVHYMPQMKMVEYEASLILKASTGFFPVLEASGEIMQGMTTLYLLSGLKFPISEGKFLGVGTQVGLTSNRDFDARVLLQLDMDW